MTHTSPWVVMADGGAHCTRCGAYERVKTPVSVDGFVAWVRYVTDLHAGCVEGMPQVAPPTSVQEWRRGPDVGTSSLTIYSVFTRQPLVDRAPDVPHDPADFGRCHRLLQLAPEWRAHLREVAEVYPAWAPFVDAWEELTALYEAEAPSGSCPQLYARMRELGRMPKGAR